MHSKTIRYVIYDLGDVNKERTCLPVLIHGKIPAAPAIIIL